MYTLSERRAIDMIEKNEELIFVISDLNSNNFIEFPIARWSDRQKGGYKINNV